MQTTKPIPGGSGPRPPQPTSAAFRKAARWLANRLQATEARDKETAPDNPLIKVLEDEGLLIPKAKS